MARPGHWLIMAGAVTIIAAVTVAVVVALQTNGDSTPSSEEASSQPSLVTSSFPVPESAPDQTETPQKEAKPKGPPAADFTGITRWINSESLSLEELRGNVVLVDFWTYSCINCIRTLPYLRDWHDKYAGRGLVIVGVHSPEFDFEKVEANVRDAIAELRVTWPVAMDNDFGTWRAYRNRYWPNKFLIDRDGRVRYNHVGEGAYLETEKEIRKLLTEANYDVSDIQVGGVITVEASRALTTRELYTGTGWASGGYLGNPTHFNQSGPADFTDPGDHVNGQYYLQGLWETDSESVRHRWATENYEHYVAINYTAASVNIVVRPEGEEPFTVLATLNGAPIPEAHRGDDILVDDQGRTYLRIDTPRLYNVIRSDSVGNNELELRVNSTAFRLYTFTFGA